MHALRRHLSAMSMALLLAAPLPGLAQVQVQVQDPLAGWQEVGRGEMRWFGIKLYGASLWAEGERYAPERPFALRLRYARDFSSEQLVTASLDEMRRIDPALDTAQLARWRDILARVLPAVRAGDTLVGIHQPGKGARFLHDGKPCGETDDAALARAFFGIWLDPRTREPALRAQLLGRAAAE